MRRGFDGLALLVEGNGQDLLVSVLPPASQRTRRTLACFAIDGVGLDEAKLGGIEWHKPLRIG
jgi:hypothetical protein